MTVKTLNLPIALVEKITASYQSTGVKRPEAIRYGLADFLLLPIEQQVLDSDAIAKILSIEEELTCRCISVRLPDELLVSVEKLADGKNLSVTIAWMLARILYCPLSKVDTECTERLLYVLGNKWNPKMQAAIKRIEDTAETEWKVSVETCAGALGIFSRSDFATKKILNDSDWNKVNLLRVIRDYHRELIVLARALEVRESTFDSLKNCDVKPSKSANIAAAARFLYLNLNSHMGECCNFDKDADNCKYHARLSQIYPLHKKLQEVSIFDKDIFDILNMYHKKGEADNTLFVVDPPYLDTSGYEKRLVSHEPSYGKGFGMEQHKKLSGLLRRIKQKDGNDFIYFCRVTVPRTKNQKTKECKNTPEELRKMDRDLELEIGRLYCGHGFYYTDVHTLSDGTVERIITSFNFDGATPYGSERGRK